MIFSRTDLVIAGLAAGMVLAVGADNWPRWNGPQGNGVAGDGDFPVQFGPDRNLAWKAPMPGAGSSTPVVWDQHIFVTGPIEGEDGLIALDWNGDERWRVRLGEQRPGKHRNGSGSNPSPVTDGERVYVYYKSGTIAAVDFAGKVVWKKNLQEMYGEDTLWWDLGTSPVLAGGRVIVAVMHEGDSYIAALNPFNGNVDWRTPRNFKTPSESDQSYTTPFVWNDGNRDQIVTWGADHVTGHDAADGSLLWTCGGFNPDDKAYWRVIASASASAAAGIAVVPYGRAKHVAGIRPGGEGDVTKSNRLWERDGFGADVPTPVVSGERVYILEDRGEVYCLDLKSGRDQWSQALPRHRSSYYASPVLAGNILFCTREDGMLFVCRVNDEGFEVIAENDLKERVIATPVPVRDRLLIRGENHLFCFASN